MKRYLDFIVSEQQLSKLSTCDFGGLVVGTSGYLHARFNFARDWVRFKRVAVFTYNGGESVAPILSNECEIPPEVLKHESFKIHCVGAYGTDRITTNTVTIMQRRC